MKLRLIRHWRKSWRMISMQCMGAALALQATWAALPVELQQHVPPSIAQALTGFLLVLGILGRIVQQPTVTAAPRACPTCGHEDGNA